MARESRGFDLGGVGPQGPPGNPGAPGAPGAPGTNGKTILNGTGTPSLSLGTTDDYYLDNATEKLYGPKIASPSVNLSENNLNLFATMAAFYNAFTAHAGWVFQSLDGTDFASVELAIIKGAPVAPLDIFMATGDSGPPNHYATSAVYFSAWGAGVSLKGSTGNPGAPGAPGAPGTNGINLIGYNMPSHYTESTPNNKPQFTKVYCPKGFQLTRLGVLFSTATNATHYQIAIYASHMGNDRPDGAPLAQTAEYQTTGQNMQSCCKPVITPITLTDDTYYWIGLIADNATQYYNPTDSIDLQHGQYYTNSYGSGFPTINAQGTADAPYSYFGM
jgi:hypothetical protein